MSKIDIKAMIKDLKKEWTYRVNFSRPCQVKCVN